MNIGPPSCQELVVLLRLATGMKPNSSADQRSLCTQLMQTIVRLGLHETQKELVVLAKPLFEKTFTAVRSSIYQSTELVIQLVVV